MTPLVHHCFPIFGKSCNPEIVLRVPVARGQRLAGFVALPGRLLCFIRVPRGCRKLLKGSRGCCPRRRQPYIFTHSILLIAAFFPGGNFRQRCLRVHRGPAISIGCGDLRPVLPEKADISAFVIVVSQRT